MRFLLRVAAIAVAGAALFLAGRVNGLMQLRPTAVGVIFVALGVAVSVALLLAALSGTGRGDARAPAPARLIAPLRAVFVLVGVASLVGLGWLRGISYPPVHDPTTYHNDGIALGECAARMVLRGEDPYSRLDVFGCYDERRIGPDRATPLRRGALAGIDSYPTEEQLDAAWDAARARGWSRGVEFVWSPSYPALSVLLILPWVAMGWDLNVLYVLCLLAAMGLIIGRATPTARPFMLLGLLGAVSLTAFTVAGGADLLYALPLTLAWLWRERRWSAVALGVACAVKQLAWPFAAFYVMQVAAAQGWREAARRAAVVAIVFVASNAPFILWDARSWVLGILTPVSEPMFPRGAGLVGLSAGGVVPLLPPSAYLALEGIAAAAALALAWRARRTSPELGIVLAMVPLWFAGRSLFSYFFLLPLFAFAAVARMPVGELSPEAARGSGAVNVLAMPVPAPRAAPR